MSNYARGEVITGFTNLYKLLERLYLPANSIKYPPSGGWQWPKDIKFDPPKSTEVIELMKHMPYLQQPKEWDSMHIYEKTEPVDYSLFNDEGPHNVDPDISLTTLPSHALMVGYTNGRNGHYIFCDTKRGTFTICDFQVGPKPTDWSEAVDDIENPVTRTDEDGEECTENWREYATYTTAEFFDKLTEDFEELELMPNFNGEVRFAKREAEDEDDEKLRTIFKECGWPGEGYKKDECGKKVKEFEDGLLEG